MSDGRLLAGGALISGAASWFYIATDGPLAAAVTAFISGILAATSYSVWERD